MRRMFSVLVIIGCGLLVSSCSLLPFGGFLFDSSDQKADAQMEKIADALNNHDSAALKDMFSPYALAQASGIDEGLEYLLSFFPDGGVTWERESVGLEGHNNHGKKSELLLSHYKVSADGEDYKLFFADFTVNDVENPDNVGIYALGVTPWTDDRRSPFGYWAGAIHLTEDAEYGYPGIYVPNDDILYPSEQAEARMGQIAAAINAQDAAALKALFSPSALEGATEFDRKLQSLLSLFPNGGLAWEQLSVDSIGDDTRQVTKLLSTEYKVSDDGKDYRFFFADFVVDTTNPENLGLASLAVTPWFEAGAPDRDQAYIDWAGPWSTPDSWISDSEGPAGIYVPIG